MRDGLAVLAFGIGMVAIPCIPLEGQVAAQAPMHAPDGGVRERIMSVTIPPVTNAPFTAVVVNCTRLSADSSSGAVQVPEPVQPVVCCPFGVADA